MTISPFVDHAVASAMERAGFSIKRAADKTIVWRRDLVGSYLHIYFADLALYGDPHLKKWVLVYGDDPDTTVFIVLDLDMFVALDVAKSIEAAPQDYPLPGEPVADTSETASAG